MTDQHLLKLADRLTGLLANGPAFDNTPDKDRERKVRARLDELLQEAVRLGEELCKVRN